MPHPSMAIANEFLRQPGALGRLTQMQMQKLAYIAHGWNLAVNQQPLISDPVQAWDFGPVFPDLYDHAKYFGDRPLNRFITNQDNNKFAFFYKSPRGFATPYEANLTDREKDVLKRVWRKYGPYSAFKLSDLTHKPGTPWFETYFNLGKNAVIPDELIQRHYRDLAKRAVV